MQLLLVSVCLAIFSSALTSASDPHYVITVRAQLVQGSQQKVCMTFLDLDGKVDFKLDLQNDEHTHVIAEGKIETPDYSQCFTFKVPVMEEDFSVWSLHVLAHGEHINIDEKKLIAIIKGYDACFIQTDKATYKPGDTVKFRVIAVDMDFRAVQKRFPLLELKNPNRNIIGQWLNVTVNHGIADFNFPLANELSLGTYKINMSGACEKDFTVSEYVLKRFELKLNVPPTIAVTDKSFHLESCGSYTYGKPVEGSINVTVCPPSLTYLYYWRSSEREEREKCILLQDVKTDSKGCLSKEIDITAFKLSKDHSKYIYVSSSLTEEGTGHIEEVSADITLSKYKSITFVEIGNFYLKGVPFHIKLRVVDEKNQPMANEAISIYQGNSEKIADLETEKNGIAHCTLSTYTWESYMYITARFSSAEGDNEESMYEEAAKGIVPFYSESKSLLNVQSNAEKIPCDSDVPVTVKYNINKSGLDPKSDHLTFFYFLLSKGRIISYKEHTLDLKDHINNPNLHGTFPINVHVDRNLAPVFEFFIFAVLPKGETIASRAQYRVSACSNNKSNGLEDSLRNGVPHFPFFIKDNVKNQCQGRETDDLRLDVSVLFESERFKVFTNTRINKPVICEPDWFAGRSSLKPKKDKSTKEKDQALKKPHTRAYFPDTWLFDLVSVGPEGHTELNLTTPDTITKWVTDAVCLGNSGVSEIKDVGLITFQPYFINLILPYSVVQGETFTIQALVFNYVKSCVLVVVSLSESEDFLTSQKKEQARCICEGQSTHFTWEATAQNLKNLKIHVSSGSLQLEGPCTDDPLSLGKDHKEDSIEKTVVVKPGGHEEQKTETFLLYPADNSAQIQVSYHVPERLVPGSARAHIIVSGDLMSNIVLNLDEVLNMAYGCGEQNIATFSRYVYALEYLQSTSELTPELKQKGMEAMIEGYQMQLTFKNENGSYGVFPGSTPNFWITALVVKAFSGAQDFIYIDQTNIQKAVTWLHNQQLPNGCFNVSTFYFNNYLEAENVVANTAYVVISLLEHHVVCNGSIVENALKCLRNEAHNVTSPYTQALVAYAFTLSGDGELRQEALKRLDKTAIKKGGTKHWETNTYREGNVETCGYVILALLSEKTTTPREVEESADIVRWVMTQQNPWGGFRSSEDTTVAIQALAKYVRATHQKKEDATVTVESKSGFHKEIHVDKDNIALLQTVDLPEFPGEYTVTATGKGCVYVQSHLHYNSLPEQSDEHFAMNVSTQPSVCTHEAQRKFEVHVDVRYTGKRAETNMAMVVVEFLSGFVPYKKSIKNLMKNPKVQKTELTKDHVTIYIDKLTHKDEKLIFALKEETHVKNLHPANILIFDYYEPNVRSVAEYNSPCNTMTGHCKVGVSERTDCGRPSITKEQCEQKGCCYNSSIPQSKWCFFQGYEKEESH